MSSFLEMDLPPRRKVELLMAIPPEEQPKRGEERVFRINFQVDRVQPTQYIVVVRGSVEEGKGEDLRKEKATGPLAKVIGMHRPSNSKNS